MSRLILNAAPRDAVAPESAAGGLDVTRAGGSLARAMLTAVAAHTRADGRLDVRALRASQDFAAAEACAVRLRTVDASRLVSRQERLAFWIDVYNALALHGVLALDVPRSVRRVWNFFGRVSYRVGAHVLSLDEIEHGILRGNRRRVVPPWPVWRAGDPRCALAVDPPDPRVHFALNCGAASCPPVGVYRAEAVEAQLDLAARDFVNREVRLDARGRVECSRLLRWYGGDFGTPRALAEFLVRHLDDGPVRAALAAGARPCTAWRTYSWALPYRRA